MSIVFGMRSVWLMLGIVTLTAGCASAQAKTMKPVVVATTTQIADFARVIGGDQVEVYDVMRSGVDPHDYQPTAADLHNMTVAAVVVDHGVGLDHWFESARQATTPHGIVVTATEGVAVHDGDPHVWLDPTNAKIMVTNIADALAKALPEYAAEFRTNLSSYLQQLDQLDTEIRVTLAPLTDRRMVTNHDAFGYFIDRYQLSFVGSIIPSFDTSADLSTSAVRRLVKRISEQHVRAIFSEASLPPKTAQAIAREAGVRVVMGDDALYGDTLGPAGSDGATYLTMMRHNALTIRQALS
jgi:zinc/manganese transport system substrate-binding protein